MVEVHNSSQSLLKRKLSVVEHCELALQMYTAQRDRLTHLHYHTNHTTGYKGLDQKMWFA